MDYENVTINNILGQTEQQTKEEYNNFRVAKIKEKLLYPILRGGVSPEQIKNIADSVKKEQISSCIALSGYIPALLANLANSQVGVAVAIGYPFGEGDIETIIHTIKKFAKKPVTEIVVVLSLSDLKFCKARQTEKILKLLSSVSKKKKVGVMLDCSRFIVEDLEKVIRIISSFNLTNIYVTTGFYGEDYSPDTIKAVKKALKKPIKIISGAQDLSTEETVSLLKDADGVFTSKTIDLLNELRQSL